MVLQVFFQVFLFRIHFKRFFLQPPDEVTAKYVVLGVSCLLMWILNLPILLALYLVATCTVFINVSILFNHKVPEIHLSELTSFLVLK